MNKSLDIRKIRSRHDVTNANQEMAKSSWWEFLNKDIRLGGSDLPDRVRERFYLELWTMLDAGVDIRTALELIRDEQKKKKIRVVFDKIIGLVIKGSSLSEAMQECKQFSSYECFGVQIGEESGKLVLVFKELAVFFQKKIRQRRHILGAITYPLVVLMVAFGAVSFMVSFVVPMFSDVFKRFGSDLPMVTRIVISISDFCNQYFGLFVVFLAGVTVFAFSQRKQEWFRKASSTMLLKIPIVGSIIQKIYLYQFANTMALLVGSRIPIVQAIQLTRKMITFYPGEHSLLLVEEHIISGVALHKSLAAHNIYPPKIVSMVKVGEEVNQLELFFGRVAEQYNNEVEYQTGMLSRLLEPLIIIVLGVVVGVILVAMYLPLFKLGQGF